MGSESALLKAARAHHQAGRWAAAEAVYRRIVDHEPQHKAIALHALGRIALEQGDSSAAAALMGQAIAIEPNVTAFYVDLVRAAEKLGDLASAVTVAEGAVALWNLSPDLLAQLFRLYLLVHRTDQALALADRIDREPELRQAFEGTPAARAARGRIRRVLGEHGAARADLISALQEDPDLGAAWHDLGRIERASGNDARAIVCYGRALGTARDAEVVYDRGVALQRVGRLDEAQTAFSEMTTKIGYALSRAADLKSAGLVDVDISPHRAESVRARGREAEQAGRPIEAITLFALAFSLLPRAEGARRDLERLLAQLGKREVRFHRLVHSSLGMIALDTDQFLRKMRLGQAPDDTLVVFLSGANPSNRSLTAMAARHMPFVVDDRIYYSMLEAMLPAFRFSDTWLWSGQYDLYTNPDIKSGWAFTPEEQERGREGMRKLGVDPDRDWYVAIFARDAGWAVKNLSGMPETYTPFRNADINACHQAIQLILDRGGTVIRMGAAPERALTFKHPKVIDYATLARDDFMDVYLAAHARFFMGTPAGITEVARAFDTPTLHVNFVVGWGHPGRQVLHLPKQLVRRGTGEPVPFAEYLAHYSGPDPIGAIFSDDGLAQNGYAYVDNTPEELSEAAEEMLDLLDGRWGQDPADQALLDRYFALFASVPHPVVSSPARVRLPVVLAHLRRYRSWYFPDG